MNNVENRLGEYQGHWIADLCYFSGRISVERILMSELWFLARGDERSPTSSPAGWDSSPCPWVCQLCVMNNHKIVLESTREFICRLLFSSGHISLAWNIISELWIWFAMINVHRPAVLRDGFPRHVHGDANFASWITTKLFWRVLENWFAEFCSPVVTSH